MLRLPLWIRSRPLLLCCIHKIICIITSGCFRPDNFPPNPLRPHGWTLCSTLGGCNRIPAWIGFGFVSLSAVGGSRSLSPLLHVQWHHFGAWDGCKQLLHFLESRLLSSEYYTRLHLAMALGSQVPPTWDLPFLDHIVNKNKNGDLSKTFILSVSSFLYVVYTLRGWRDCWALCRKPEFNSQKIYNGL